MITDEVLHRLVGTRVKHLVAQDGVEYEYGVIINAWVDENSGCIDCHIAFFGPSFPRGVPTEKPYVLRYFLESVIPVDIQGKAVPLDCSGVPIFLAK